MNTRKVIVRDRASESAAWGTSSAEIVITKEITLDWTGRNEPTLSSGYEDGVSYAVHRWTRQDGKIDSYADVLKEAETNGLNVKKEAKLKR
jgi:hypothetical protein